MPSPTKRGRPPNAEIYGTMLLVRDIGASVAFYRRTLRLKGEATGPWAELHNEGSRLVLLDRRFWTKVSGAALAGSDRGSMDSVVIAVQVPDVVREHKRLRAKGIAFEQPPTAVPQMGVRMALLRDPDGHLVELTTMLTPDDFAELKAASG